MPAKKKNKKSKVCGQMEPENYKIRLEMIA